MKYTLLLLLTTTAFGTSYVFCNMANQFLPPFMMNLLRYGIAAIAILPFTYKRRNQNMKIAIKGGFLLSLTIFTTGYIQQLCVSHLPSGKMGFIASLYVILVPIVNKIFFKKEVSLKVFLSIILGLVGLLVLCNIQDFSVSKYEFGMFMVAVIYVFNILWMDKYSKKCSSHLLVFWTFVFTVIFNLICTLSFETTTIANIKGALPSLLYLGVVSSCISYVAQAHAQRHINPVIASVVMSLESVVSVIAGVVAFGQMLSNQELIGCLIMLISVMLCQYFTYKESLQ